MASTNDISTVSQYLKARNGSCAFRLERVLMEEFVGNVQGKNMVDLFCGEGAVTIGWKQKGASNVLGIDPNPNCISIAEYLESVVRSGTKFITSDLCSPDPYPTKKGPLLADIVTIEFGLCNAESLDMLKTMLVNCVATLKTDGGKFIVSAIDPPQELGWFDRNRLLAKKYGVWYSNYEGGNTLDDGDPVRTNVVITGKRHLISDHYWYSPKTYTRLLNDLGFDVDIYHPRTCPKAVLELKDELQEYLYEPPIFFIIATCKGM